MSPGIQFEEQPRIACPPFRPAFVQHICDEPWACCLDNTVGCTSASGRFWQFAALTPTAPASSTSAATAL
eukprot:6828062-Alexandrium_andersonii.AAC.1